MWTTVRQTGAALLAVLTIASCHDTATEPHMRAPASGDHGRVVVTSPNVFTQVGTGGSHACGLRGDGLMECWGYNGDGRAPATKAAASGSFTTIGVGWNHTCAVRSDGVVECGGENYDGRAPASRAPASGSFTAVTAGSFHTCALRSDGVVECWGDNYYGVAPASRAAMTGKFVQVSAAQYHTCALRDDGVAECWGRSGWPGVTATRAATTGTFAKVSASYYGTCGLRSDGVLECWGDNYAGQLPPTQTAATGYFTDVSAGHSHVCAVRNDGVVECWGASFYGEAQPTKVAAQGAFNQVSAHFERNCALRGDGVVECWGYNTVPTVTASPTITHLYPSATFTAPTTVNAGLAFSLSLANAQVPGYSGAVTFSYAFDCGDGSGYGAFGAGNSANCLTSTIGMRSVKGTVRDHDGDETEYTGSVFVVYPFGGFVGPVDAPPVVNTAKAGSAIPVKFSLGANRGISILAAGYPVSQPIGCSASSATDPIEQTVTAGSSSLTYDANTGMYSYIWKTEKAWGGTCRLLTIRLVDGTDHTALFKFN
jgi:Regulator of Chromosome Condensation (RCC1) repeat protein